MAFSPVQIDLTVGGAETVGSANAKTNANMSQAQAVIAALEARLASIEQTMGQPQNMAGWGSASDSIIYSGNAQMWTNAAVQNQVVSGATAQTRPDTSTTPGIAGASHSWSILHNLGNGLVCASWRLAVTGTEYINVNGVQISQTGAMTPLLAAPYSSSNTAQIGVTTATTHAKISWGSGASFSLVQGNITTASTGYNAVRIDVTWTGSAFSCAGYAANTQCEDGQYWNDLLYCVQHSVSGFPLTWGSTREKTFPTGTSSYLYVSMTGGTVGGGASNAGVPLYKIGTFQTPTGTGVVLQDCLVYAGIGGQSTRPGHDMLTSSSGVAAFPSRAKSGSNTPALTVVLFEATDSVRCLAELHLQGYGVTSDVYVHGMSDSMFVVSWKDSATKGRIGLFQINSGTVAAQTVYTIQLVAIGYTTDIFGVDLIQNYFPFDATRGAILTKTTSLAEWKLIFVSYSIANNVWSVLGTKTVTVGTAGATSSAQWAPVRRVWPNVLAILSYEQVSGAANAVISTIALS